MTTEQAVEWTAADSRIAESEGWGIFEVGGGRKQIQMIDTAEYGPQLDSDDDALALVIAGVTLGKVHSVRALALCGPVYTGSREPGKAPTFARDDVMAHSAGKSEPLPLYLDECNKSPTGFEWGYEGSGPAQLAYALIRHAMATRGARTSDEAREIAMETFQEFKRRQVARWSQEPGSRWYIQACEVVVAAEQIIYLRHAQGWKGGIN